MEAPPSVVGGGAEREHRRTRKVLEHVVAHLGLRRPSREDIVHRPGPSNDVLEARIGGRRLMVKRGLNHWSSRQFHAAREATECIQADADRDIVVPTYLDIPSEIEGWAVLAWWRVEISTLAEVWGALDAAQRSSALRSLGRLLGRLHDIPADRWGPLGAAADGPEPDPHPGFVETDVGGRLRYAALGSWPEGVLLIDALLERLADLDGRLERPCIVHNDPNSSNVFCVVERDSVSCPGLLDLEAASGGLSEADLSYLELVHSPLMAGGLGGDWMAHVLEGYPRSPDSDLMVFFRLYHILNIGIHAALCGDEEKADHLAALGRSTLARDGTPLRA